MSHNQTPSVSPNGSQPPAVPDPEVVPKAQRRQFTAEYKRRILQEVEACTQAGQIGALLRREGLYSSHLSDWRRQREQGELAGLSPHPRGPQPDPQDQELVRLQRENAQLRTRLEQAETVLEIQKKLSQLLGLNSHPTQSGEPG